MRANALLIALLVWVRPASAAVETVRTFDPRPFGYFVGDLIERTFEIDTAASDKLEPASLPRPGALNYWLEIRDVTHKTRVKQGIATHTVSVTYQTFYAPIDPRKISVPELRVAVATANGPEEVALPGFTFIASPLREIFPEKSGETSETFLRPDPAPKSLLAAAVLERLAAFSIATVAFLALLARQLAWWPFHQRSARPFSRAAREIAHILAAPAGTAALREAALVLHRAFDESAGERLFAADVPRFIERHPEHVTSSEQIARFFKGSRALFFGGEGGEALISGAQLKDLAFRLRSEERAAR